LWGGSPAEAKQKRAGWGPSVINRTTPTPSRISLALDARRPSPQGG
jgi:hypothetical protein